MQAITSEASSNLCFALAGVTALKVANCVQFTYCVVTFRIHQVRHKKPEPFSKQHA